MGDNVFNCGHCTFQTNAIEKLEEHLKSKHPDPDEFEFRCSLCSYATAKKRNLQRHFSSQHVKKSITTTDDASEGTTKHNEKVEEMFKCNLCDFSCNSSKGVGVHKFRSHSLPRVVTSFEQHNKDTEEAEMASGVKKEKTPIKLETESDKQQPQNVNKTPVVSKDILKVCIRCSACEFMCNSLRSMAEHIESVHSCDSNQQDQDVSMSQPEPDSPEPSAEDDCSPTDSKEPQLTLGLKCKLCSKSYDQNWKLNRHLRTSHSFIQEQETNDETIEKGSSKAYSSMTQEMSPNPSENSATYTSISKHGPSPCQFCGRVLSSSSNLKRHILSLHRNEDNSQSDISNTVVQEDDNLQSDNSTSGTIQEDDDSSQSNSSPKMTQNVMPTFQRPKFECDVCNAKFTRRFTLRQHYTKHEQKIKGDTKNAADVDNEESTVCTCKICFEKVIGKSKLKLHVKKYHYNIKGVIDLESEDGDNSIEEHRPKKLKVLKGSIRA